MEVEHETKTGFFIPTAQTALFILAGENLKRRFSFYYMFEPGFVFEKENILKFQDKDLNFNFPLQLTAEVLDTVTTGRKRKPVFGLNFPAKLIETKMDWDDLVLEAYTLEQVFEIKAWIDFGDALLDDEELAKRIKPGYRSLFYGPPGTGKTLVASLIGKVSQLRCLPN